MLKGKIALITGGSRGIGRAICVELAARKYDIIINYRSDHARARETLSMVKEQGVEGKLACFDVTDAETSQAALEALVR